MASLNKMVPTNQTVFATPPQPANRSIPMQTAGNATQGPGLNMTLPQMQPQMRQGQGTLYPDQRIGQPTLQVPGQGVSFR
jgi:hypothetical protein